MADVRFDLLIRNGLVFDGTGAEPRAADVGVVGGKIAAAGKIDGSAAETIDAAGLAVAPGFIDSHTHSDFPSLMAPLAENRLHAGVTTEICGNCGFSAAPIDDASVEHYTESYPAIKVDWRTHEEFFAKLEGAGSSINRAFLCGFGNLRRVAMKGDHDRAASADEMAKMRELLAAALDAGAVGLSTGLIYPPACFAAKEEIAAIAAGLSGTNYPYASHVRSESDALIEAIDEARFIAETAACPCHISHLKVNARRNWSKISELRAWWGRRDSYKVRVTADAYPYTAGHTGLDSILPQWTYVGGMKAELARLKSDRDWERIREEVLSGHNDAYWPSVMIGETYSHENKRYEGMMLEDAARVMGLAPVEAVRALLAADATRTMAMFFSMSEQNVREILSWDGVALGSDSSSRAPSGPTAAGAPHPRAFGTTGRFLRYARDEKVVPLAAAIHKMTGLTARIFNLEGRGEIAKGKWADIVVFDPAAISDRATYEDPAQYTVGVKALFVNGAKVFEDGAATGARPGRVLRHGR